MARELIKHISKCLFLPIFVFLLSTLYEQRYMLRNDSTLHLHWGCAEGSARLCLDSGGSWDECKKRTRWTSSPNMWVWSRKLGSREESHGPIGPKSKKHILYVHRVVRRWQVQCVCSYKMIFPLFIHPRPIFDHDIYFSSLNHNWDFLKVTPTFPRPIREVIV